MKLPTLRKLAVHAGFVATAALGVSRIPMILNPETRGLTPAEIEFAQGIFGDKDINYPDITLHKGTRGLDLFCQSKPNAVTLGNHIFICEPYLKSQKSWDNKAFKVGTGCLIHELTHARQFSQGTIYKQLFDELNPVTFLTEHGGEYDNLYGQDAEKKHFEECNFEQQGNAVGAYAYHLIKFKNDMKELSRSVNDPAQRREAEENAVFDYYFLEQDMEFMKGSLPLPSALEAKENYDATCFQFKHNLAAIVQKKERQQEYESRKALVNLNKSIERYIFSSLK